MDINKCIACGLCAEKCPKKVPDEHNLYLSKRKAIFVKYAQAVPLKYVIDSKHCLYLTRGKCRLCEKFCPTGAINFEDKEETLTIKAGAVVLTVGNSPYDPGQYDLFGYKKHPNIVTSMEFDRSLSVSGPYDGQVIRPSDKKEPEKIAWFQCIGSRNAHKDSNGYCSVVCCTYAIKQAMLAKEHCNGNLDTAIFYIDIRTHGKDFERYYNRAKNEMGVRFIKSKTTNIIPVDGTGRHLIRYIGNDGRLIKEEFDIVVLSVGLCVSEQVIAMARRLNIELNSYNFAETSSFEPVQSSRPGIYVSGSFQAPKDIPSSVVDSSAAAGVIGSRLAKARWTLTKTEHTPKEINVFGESIRIGVFVCCCGSNIARTVDVPAVVEFAKELPYVVYAEQNLFSCSQDTQNKMAQIIKEQQLNRVVVAACTPKTHEQLFQKTMINAGINKYLFEMANIRNQCSWVHSDNIEIATEKAKNLVRMSVAKAALLEPLVEPAMNINQTALVIGGGVAGMEASKNLAAQGYRTCLLEKTDSLGGQAKKIDETWRGEDVQQYLADLIQDVKSAENIEIFLNSEIKQVDGFAGNFKTTINIDKNIKEIEHGVTIIASGASELKTDQYYYGKDPRVLTALDLQQKFINKNSALMKVNTAVFIQCVGSRIPQRPHCSRICCTMSIKSALKLKEINPQMNVVIIYREMRSYGLREEIYREARKKGIVFIRYDFDNGLSVDIDHDDLKVSFNDYVLKRQMEIRPDLLILATAIVPKKNNPLCKFYKVAQNEDGFFLEAHVKLRPNDFATDGMFLCGLAHAPKSIDESITQAQAAVARAVTMLSAKTISAGGTVAYVDPGCCSGCGACVSICPYSAPKLGEKDGKAEIQSALCKGCGLCVASCRSGAINLKGFETSQIMAMIDSCMA